MQPVYISMASIVDNWNAVFLRLSSKTSKNYLCYYEWVRRGITSHSTHYTSKWLWKWSSVNFWLLLGVFTGQMTQPTVSQQLVVKIRLQSYVTTPPCCNNTTHMQYKNIINTKATTSKYSGVVQLWQNPSNRSSFTYAELHFSLVYASKCDQLLT